MQQIPAHLPLEEALEYKETCDDTVTRTAFRQNDHITVGGFADFVLGKCPVRNSSSMWLIDDTGRLWTSRFWHDQGTMSECWDGAETTNVPWPMERGETVDYFHLVAAIHERGPRWGNGVSLTLEEFNGWHLGLWDGISASDRRLVRALMIYGFDQEWGIGSFRLSVTAARHKHRRSVTRIRRKEYARGATV